MDKLHGGYESQRPSWQHIKKFIAPIARGQKRLRISLGFTHKSSTALGRAELSQPRWVCSVQVRALISKEWTWG